MFTSNLILTVGISACDIGSEPVALVTEVESNAILGIVGVVFLAVITVGVPNICLAFVGVVLLTAWVSRLTAVATVG